MGIYTRVRMCINCKHQLSTHWIVNNGGVCYKCGREPEKPIVGRTGKWLVETTTEIKYVPGLFEPFYRWLTRQPPRT